MSIGRRYGFGTLTVLIIRLPLTKNKIENGWKARSITIHRPSQKSDPVTPAQYKTARSITSSTLVGMGVPSSPHFSGRGVGEGGRRDVEPGETTDSAADEIGETDRVPQAAQAERVTEHRGGHAERYDVGKRIQIRPEPGLPCFASLAT